MVERRGGETRTLDVPLLPALRAHLGPPAVEVPGLPRFTGGAVGYLSYDAVRLFESLPDRHAPSDAPLASFSFYRSLVAFDHVLQRILLIANADPGSHEAFDRAQSELDALETALTQAGPRAPERGRPAPELAMSDGAAYQEAVRRAKEHIAKGDIFQVVLSRQGSAACALDPFDVYRALRMVNPSPYMYFLKDGADAVAGASPEMLVRVEGRRAEVRPIAGTRPRGADAAEDEALGRELLGGREGAGRAHHAGGPRPQRPRARLPVRVGDACGS